MYSFEVWWDGWVTIVILSMLNIFSNHVTTTTTTTTSYHFSIKLWLLLFLLLFSIFDVRVDQTTYSTTRIPSVTDVWRICQNMPVYTANFQDSYNLLQTTNRPETCSVYTVTIPQSSLQVSDVYAVPTRFYEFLNEH